MSKVIVSVNRTYTKQVQLEVDVPDDVEDVLDYLDSDNELNDRINNAFDKAVLYEDEQSMEWEEK
jgi:hypothetical protein